MLKPQVHQSEMARSLLLLPKPFVHGHAPGQLPFRPLPDFHKKQNFQRVCSTYSNVEASIFFSDKPVGTKVKATVTVQLTVVGLLTNVGIGSALDDLGDLFGRSLLLELVSAELDPSTGKEKATIKDYAHMIWSDKFEVKYECDFDVPDGFGDVGAVLVENQHHKEMWIKDIVLDGFPNGKVTVSCDSWVCSKSDDPEKRIFFTDKSYLPSQTPNGLKKLRQKDLQILRGNGEGERKSYERIYDYDTYNDLGDPDSSDDKKRPVLGGKEHPYPRRCRTGRKPSTKDPSSESRTLLPVYIPRDEKFSEVKLTSFGFKGLQSALNGLIPVLESFITDENFEHFPDISALYREGVKLPKSQEKGFFETLLPRLVEAVSETGDNVLLFKPPELLDRDLFSWFKDEEFSRQTLAGLNPCCIELLKEWPIKSKLDPNIYGSPDSAITKEIIEKEINNAMTVEEAIERKRLFIIDYHDLLLPYVNRVREIKGTTLYGSRTVFYLTDEGTLQPVAIELTRPPSADKPQWKQVFRPTWDATDCWLWRLAKAHVCAHDAGYHQFVSHWLRTHCCMEPFIIAANRQLSAMHPIYRLLKPYFRYTMEINALARLMLVNADGIIESTFSQRKYCIEYSSAVYDKKWRFDMEGLPADLIRRGMAVEDPNAEHGLKLTIEDYPYANDGLMLWDAIKQFVSEYVNHYYPTPGLIKSDEELQAWWKEVRNEGHGDKKDEPWWPVLNTQDDLIQVVTTLIWIGSGHHAAVNFGQYHYGGYFPNRPTIIRNKHPAEDATEAEFDRFLRMPELALLESLPTRMQATKVMVVLDVLSNHSPDEEYLGSKPEPAWKENPVINAAFERFNGRLKEFERKVDAKNKDLNLHNRTGAGVIPYELLKPFSTPGVTGKGVPNSISI